MSSVASTPDPPYVAVVFTSTRTDKGREAYDEAATRMIALAHEQPGFLGIESARGADGLGITVSYWQDDEAAGAFGRVMEHREVQRSGRDEWYATFALRVCRVERVRTFEAD